MTIPLRLLLADDNLPDQMLAEVAFESQDLPVDVTYCVNGQEVMETLLAAETVKPDVVVLDLNMPVMDGHETLRRIRAHPALQHYPVAILTSLRSADDIQRAYAQHASVYMIKALDLEQFTRQMAAFVEFYSCCRFSPSLPAAH
ncbi:response regulator [Deinococcus xianganensis]|uniref:Response regulator n=1 Tax=Deinococcus xianganensis TaxID=1507289 RepID=A0A6I4YGT3_9DEIO|nr:response regulator [Deinococcus xianganensis]MXV19186.1 response regulator [Deinococcus xianganensis]